MGIEPLLCLSVVLFGFVLQGGLALKAGLQDRWDAGAWMRGLCARYAEEHGLLEAARNRWSGRVEGLAVELQYARSPWAIGRIVESRTGVRQPGWLSRYLPLGAASTLITIRLPEPLPAPFTIQSLGDLPGPRLRLGDPVVDQLLRVSGRPDSVDEVRASVRDPAVAAAIVELLGRYPLSVVSEREVHVWIVGPVGRLGPVLDLIRELVVALSSRVERPAARTARQRARAADR